MENAIIEVTTDKRHLSIVWNENWANEHAGKRYNAVIKQDGWAETDSTKFPCCSYKVIKDQT